MRRQAALLLAAALPALHGCEAARPDRVPASVRLNNAMNYRVHVKYLDLFYAVDSRDRAAIRGSATELLEVLDDPVIAGYSSDARYRELLGETRRAIRTFLEAETGVGSAAGPSPRDLRGEVVKACEACHVEYRR